jgi:hypothetical protein
MRRRIWQNREIPVEPEHWLTIRDENYGPDGEAERSELLERHGCGQALIR